VSGGEQFIIESKCAVFNLQCAKYCYCGNVANGDIHCSSIY